MKKITKTKSVKKIEKPTKQVVRIIKLPNQGEAGYTPVKDKDYFDGKTPVKGVDYNDGKDGYTPQKGIDYNDGEKGNDGKDGYTPKKGVDYFDGKQGPRGPSGKPFPEAKVKQMVNKNVDKKIESIIEEVSARGNASIEQTPDGMNLIIDGKKHHIQTSVYGPKQRNFIQLGDSPGTYQGSAGKFLKVNSTETGIEYGVGGSGAVVGVTGLNTDNTDPTNPIIQISVDGVTVTGLGTPGSPLVAVGDGTGDVHGPASSTDNAIARFDSTTGKIIQNSGITIADGATGTLSGTNTGDQDLSGLVPYTGATGDVTLGVHGLTLHDIKGDASDGLLIEANNGTDIAILGAGNTANGTWYGSHNIEGTQVAIGKNATTIGKLKLYGNTSGDVTIQPNAVAGTGVVLTAPATTGTLALTSDITGTNSGTNTGDQTITNSSDATSHTVTLSASGGSVQLIEGANITLTTGGTGSAGTVTIAASGGSGATTALDNLAAVAINTTLVSDTDNTDDLGTTLKKWANLFVTTIGATATRVTKGWFTDLEVTNAITGSITGNAATATNVAVGGITGLGTGVGTFLATPSSANLASAVTDETGSGSLVFATSPTLVTPALGTPASGVMTNVTGTATGLTSGITNALKSATTTVDVSAATAPTSGQVLTATAGTTATWQTPSGAGTKIGLGGLSQTTTQNTTTETTHFTTTVAAGTLGTANAMRFRIGIANWGALSTGSCTIRVKYGGTTIASFTANNNSGGTVSGLAGFLEGVILANASTSSQGGYGNLLLGDAAAVTGSNFTMRYGNGTAAIDSTASQDFLISVQWNNASNSNTITTEFYSLEKIA